MRNFPHHLPATEHVVRLPVLGVMTTFATNAPAVLELVHETYGGWAGIAADAALTSPSPTRVTILLDRARAAAGARGQPVVDPERVPDQAVVPFHTRGGVGIADTAQLCSIAYVTPELLSRPYDFIERMLEPLTLLLLAAQDRQPLHAAGVTRGEVGVVLAAPSGTGKSTLTYAATRAGFAVLADEPVYIQLCPRLRIWGRRARIHLPVDARAHFPELVDTPPRPLATGKRKLVVENPGAWRRYAERVGICVLRRRPGFPPELEPLAPAHVVAELGTDLDPGYDLFAATIGERIARIAERGAWRLTLGDRPDDALPLLEQVTATLAAQPA